MLSYLIAFHPPQGHYSAYSKVCQAIKKDPLRGLIRSLFDGLMLPLIRKT
jgi:hypothetical protein